MVSAVSAITLHTGWLRSRQFDVTFVQGVAALAILSGLVVVPGRSSSSLSWPQTSGCWGITT